MLKATLLTLAALIVLAPTTAQAQTDCGDTTLQAVIDLGSTGCIIGDKLFSDFSYQIVNLGGGTEPSASDVNFHPLAGTLIGFQLQSLWLTDSYLDVALAYNVSIYSGTLAITDAHWTVNGLQYGVLGGSEDLCLGGDPENACAGGTEVAGALNPNPSGGSSTPYIFPEGVSSVGVVKDLSLTFTSGSPQDAQYSVIQQRWSQSEVPEPTTYLLMGTGLLALGIGRRYRRRNKKAQS